MLSTYMFDKKQLSIVLFIYRHSVDLRHIGEVGGAVEWSLSTWMLQDHWAWRSWPGWGGCSVGLSLQDKKQNKS